ncbi:phosphotriesterase-related protein [Kineothrix alysoides]|uniref:Phosphotriesterase-related protein n=1 Tax=Kineothrix alysoides TaxID=1469948 RepID=A0A4R1R3Z7_9FIRM|nr:hypothetical protein [Kineothrix alysoides]TCL60118.1 phosphotriesterase-related protein [Kineothrix alysoides]
MIQTVLGDILPGELGVTMCHEHISMDLSHVRQDKDSVFRDRELILAELTKLKDFGGKSVVEVTSADMGRKIDDLVYYSTQLGINIIASTGAYLKPYHNEWILNSPIDEIARYFIKEITTGVEDTNIKAGIIAEIATSGEVIYESEKKVFYAAGLASAATGCAVSTHCDMGANGISQIDMLIKAEADPKKIILGHIDLAEDIEYQVELLERGVNIAYDTIGKVTYLPDTIRARNLVKLIDQGYEDRLLLSQDVSRISYMTAYGGKGYTAVLGCFVDMLEEMGVSQERLCKLLIENPARILNIEKE